MRPQFPERGIRSHQDYSYFARGSEKMIMGLVLDLSRLGEGTTTLTERMDIGEFEVSWPCLRFRRELEVTVVVVRSGHDLDITIGFAGERQGDCDRCLKPYQHPFIGELRALGRKGGADHPLAGQDGV